MHDQCLQGWSIEEACTFLIFEPFILLHFFRFHFVFLFVKSYVGWEVCALASHLHVFCFQSNREGGGGKNVSTGGATFAGGSVLYYMPCYVYVINPFVPSAPFFNSLKTENLKVLQILMFSKGRDYRKCRPCKNCKNFKY